MADKAAGVNERFLNKQLVEQEIFRIMNPLLVFEGVLPEITTDSRSVIYKQEQFSNSSDPKKKKPRKRITGSKFPFIGVTDVVVKGAVLSSDGHAGKLDRNAITQKEGVDEIARLERQLGFALAENHNNNIISELETNANAPTTNFGDPTDWDASGADPISDLINLSQDMRQEGFPYRANQIYLNDTNWYELLKHVTQLDNRQIDFESRIGEGSEINLMNINKLPGMNIWGLLSGIDEGDVLALDENNPAGTIYNFVDPKFGVTRVDETLSSIQIHQFTDNDTHDEILQVWKDSDIAIKEPNAVFFADNKI